MKRLTALLLLLMSTLTGQAVSQQGGKSSQGSVTGRVIDSALQVPIEYATIILFTRSDSLQVTGTVTDKNGNFRLTGVPQGSYFIKGRFIGYRDRTIEDIVIGADRPVIDLGTLYLEPSALIMEGEEVVAERPPMEYRIDRKVINVSGQPVAPSGTAVDVLENVPSVDVDIEGNVRLRGSANFTVLVDGLPTLQEPSESLQQIPASAIDNIEIITNPSARYDPEGTSGIINVVMKKGELRSESGIVNANAGLSDKYGGDILLGLRRERFNSSFGVDFNQRSYPGTVREENETSREDSTSYVRSDGDSNRGWTGTGLRGSLDYNPRPDDRIGLGFRYGRRSMESDSDLDYDEWTEPGGDHLLYLSRNRQERSGRFLTANLDYRHRFTAKDHEITGQVITNHRESDEETVNELLDPTGTLTSGQRSTEEGPMDDIRMKLDYTLPLGGAKRLETGYQSRFSRSEVITGMLDYDPASGEYIPRPDYIHRTDSRQDIHSVYGIYSGERGSFGYQGGIRGEYTDRWIAVEGEGEPFTLHRWDGFPTAHLSYRLTGGRQVIASYTRRIERPRGWYLEPFETWIDAYNVQRGNPALDPEAIDSYELGYQTGLGKHLLSTEAYYRVTHDKVERIRSVYDDNITLHTYENIGTDHTLGAELRLTLALLDAWGLDVTGNFYDYRVKGELLNEPFSRESFNWKAQLQHTLKLARSTRIQVSNIYNSATVTSQGRREGFFTTNVTLRQDFFNGAVTASVEASDIFRTSRSESTSEGADFHQYSEYIRQAPVIMFNLSYKINNGQAEREKDRPRIESEEGEEF